MSDSSDTGNLVRPLIHLHTTRTVPSTSHARLQSASQEPVLLKPQKDPKFSLQKRLIDTPVGPSTQPTDSFSQTDWYLPKNFGTQYASSDFALATAADEAQQDTLAIDGAIVEEALQSNETLNVFTEDLPRASDGDFTSTSLRELRNFHDVTYTKSKRISSVALLPGRVVAGYAPAAAFNELVEAEGQPKTAHFLLWKFEDALAAERVFASTHVVNCLKVVFGSLVVCGLASGQIALYSLSVGRSVSDVNISHRRGVVAVETIPDTTGFQILSASGDGQAIIWEVSNSSLQIRKIHSVQLTRSENATELSIAGLRHLHGSTFAVATEEGELAVCDWRVKPAVGDERKPDYVQYISSNSTRSFRPTVAFDKSDLCDALLVVTDWAAHIFRPAVSEPLVTTPAPVAYYSCGAFSRTRAGVLYLGRVDGVLEVWDFTDQSNKPLMTFAVGSAALTCLALEANGESLAAGDDQGHLHVLQVPTTLQTPQARETHVINKMLAKEEKRVAHFRARFAILAEEREEREKTDLLEKQRVQVASDSVGKGGFSAAAGSKAGAAETDDPDAKKMQAEYEALKKAFESAKKSTVV